MYVLRMEGLDENNPISLNQRALFFQSIQEEITNAEMQFGSLINTVLFLSEFIPSFGGGGEFSTDSKGEIFYRSEFFTLFEIPDPLLAVGVFSDVEFLWTGAENCEKTTLFCYFNSVKNDWIILCNSEFPILFQWDSKTLQMKWNAAWPHLSSIDRNLSQFSLFFKNVRVIHR